MKKILATIALLVFVTIISACEPQDGSRVSRFLHTNQTDALKLEQDYEGFSFIEDAIGLVEFVRCSTNHGHEGVFREPGSDEEENQDFWFRLNGIETPAVYVRPGETRTRPEEWSIEAMDHTCAALSNAERIVLQYYPDQPRRDGTDRQRYLAYVWYDNGNGEFRNLNLELVELAYATIRGVGDMYREVIQTAFNDTQATGRRIHGEDDPDPRTG